MATMTWNVLVGSDTALLRIAAEMWQQSRIERLRYSFTTVSAVMLLEKKQIWSARVPVVVHARTVAPRLLSTNEAVS